ncbi:MAG TPA: carbohydrate binding domain-containing protein [Rhodothermales bacterium]
MNSSDWKGAWNNTKHARSQVWDGRGRNDMVGFAIRFLEGLPGVRAANPEVRLSTVVDEGRPDDLALSVEYPMPTEDPAARDVWCEVEQPDWTAGRALAFSVKPAHATRLSVSFLDRNRVAYTAWVGLEPERWQAVRIPFEQIRPNPYFQIPGVDTGRPIDVSEVKHIGFAPHDESSGSFTISSIAIAD